MTDKQRTYDIVVAHLRKQNAQSFDADNGGTRCAYRGTCGLRCAVGALIPDELYTAEFEGLAVYEGGVQTLMRDLGYDIPLLAALQSMHDWHTPNEWEAELAVIAEYHDLYYTPPCPINPPSTPLLLTYDPKVGAQLPPLAVIASTEHSTAASAQLAV